MDLPCDRNTIISIPFSTNDLHSCNRKKTGYSAFVSAVLAEFSNLNYEAKKQLLINSRIHNINQYANHEMDPVIYDPPPTTSSDKIRLASKQWAQQPTTVKAAWKERADIINNLPILGAFKSIPEEVREEDVLKCINNEMKRFNNLIIRALRRPPRFQDSMLYKNFGTERIIVRSKIFRSFHMSHLLKVTFFGRDYCLVKSDEIVYRTKKCTVIHVNSKERMESLFKKNGICAFSVTDVKDEEKGYGCGGRLILNEKESNLQHIAYVMEEGEGAVNVQLENGRMESFSKPELCKETGRWILRDNGRYSIVEYDPVRIKVLEEGNVHIMFHKFTYAIENGNLM